MSDRDDLADIIASEHFDSGGDPSVTAGDILAAGFHRDRTITTDASLDLLPEKTTIVDADGDAWQKRDGWREIDNEEAPHRGRFPSLPAVCVWNGGDNE